MKLSEFLPQSISSEKYEYTIQLINRMPLQVSIMYKGFNIWSIKMSKDGMIFTMFSECTTAEYVQDFLNSDDYIDDTLRKQLSFMIEFLKSNIEQGFVDRYIDSFMK